MRATRRVLGVPLPALSASILPLAACNPSSGGPPANDDAAYAIALQADGKLVVAGESRNGASFGTGFALARYDTGGSLDGTFGDGGRVVTVMGEARARAVAVQADGKIVVGGTAWDGADNFALVRYRSDGSPDAAFGTSGRVLVDVDGGVAAIAIQGDGQILAGGSSFNGSAYDFALVRLDDRGALDTSFGAGGRVITYSGGGLGSGIADLALQADGKIVAAGGSYLVRYNDDGSLDASFGAGGMLETGSYYEQTSAVAVQADGRLVAAGSSLNGLGSYDLALARTFADGSPDTAFGVGGRAVTAVMSLYRLEPARVAVSPIDGTILAAGFSQFEIVVARHLADGSPDTSFASLGSVLATADGYWGPNGFVHDLALQADGKIVLAGSSYTDASGRDFALARLGVNGSLDPSFGTAGTVKTGL
jgi:uncharacterized delta-60 repeat protein